MSNCAGSETQVTETNKILRYPSQTSAVQPARRKTPKARLTAGERDGLRYLGLYRHLDVAAFMHADGCKTSKAENALDALLQKGLVDRGWMRRERTERQKQLGLSAGPDEAVFKLTTPGVRRGQAEGLIEQSVKPFSRLWNGSDAPADIRHRLLIVKFMIEVRQAIAVDHTRALLRMVPDFIFVNRRRATRDSVQGDQVIVADLIFEIETFAGDRSTMFFVEVQRTRLQPNSKSTKKTTIATKLSPYQDYLTSQSRSFTGADQDVVLYIADEAAGWFNNIVGDIPWDDVGTVRNVIRMSTFEDIAGDVFGPHWLDHQGETKRIAR